MHFAKLFNVVAAFRIFISGRKKFF